MAKVIYGIHALAAALNHQPENILTIYAVEQSTNPRITALLAQARTQGLGVQSIHAAKLTKLAGSDHHQGIAAVLKANEPLGANEVLAWLKTEPKTPLLLLLENIQDPHNLGACLRTAEALGVDWVVLPKHHTAPLDGAVSKTACGADHSLSIALVPNLVRFIEQIKDAGVWVVGTSGQASQPVGAAALTRNLALVMGAEGKGLKALTISACDEMAYIPMLGSVASLNVSVATGICLYECQRQRRSHGFPLRTMT